jgi:hypothetical protein
MRVKDSEACELCGSTERSQFYLARIFTNGKDISICESRACRTQFAYISSDAKDYS